MARTTLTQNLKLRLSSDLTADSKYNLEKLDTLGSLYQTDTNQAALIRSVTSITLQPNSPDIGGSGSGGTVQIGTVDQPLTSFTVNASSINLGGGLAFNDTATGGTRSLNISYKSDISGSVDTAADRNLAFDLEGADRELIIPGSGTLALLDASQTLTNKTIDAGSNTLTGLTDSSIASGAAISGEKIDPDFGTQIILTTGGFASTSGVPFKLPIADGTAGQVIQTDGSGQLTFVTATSNTLSNLLDTNITGPTNGQVLQYNGSEWVNATSSAAVGAETAYIWEPADGSVKTITHNLGTQQVMVTVLDTTNNYQNIEVPDTTRPDGNTVILSATSAPQGGNWLVLVKQIIT